MALKRSTGAFWDRGRTPERANYLLWGSANALYAIVIQDHLGTTAAPG